MLNGPFNFPADFGSGANAIFTNMFRDCVELVTTSGLSSATGFGSGANANFSQMFLGCAKLNGPFDFPEKFGSGEYANFSVMFANCGNLTTASFPTGFGDGSNTTYTNMFTGTTPLIIVILDSTHLVPKAFITGITQVITIYASNGGANAANQPWETYAALGNNVTVSSDPPPP